MARRPKLLVCSVEFLADSQVGGVDDPICQLFNFSQVRNVILKNRLSPAGTRPIVCIDEAQVLLFRCWNVVLTNNNKVLDPDLGWSDFRSDYGPANWRWLAAATRAR